ncbi:hypothetical protein [Synechococcus sp. PROS-9-1]|uniref:hypothetical protein n=1 Tax=Synechococcus sp. PROS-9-1 TaxID=1968775 RepID=UPI0016457DDD|nr:hypothetical protein [Synechococcus sp. PROS-9-1]
MGITKQVIKALIAEHSFRPISGNWLSFGSQTVNVDKSTLINICGQSCVDKLSLDTSTRHGAGSRYSDSSLIESLFSVSYKTVDKSAYESSNLVLDLSRPIPPELESSYDFLYTGGCLDNVFSPADVLINSSRLLNSNGRVLHYESASRLLGAFTFVTAEWFLSYYAANNFLDCKVYLLCQTKPGLSRFDYDVHIFNYSHEFTRSKNLDYFRSGCSLPGIQYLLVVAEKGPSSTCDVIPDQLQYLDSNSVDWPNIAKKYSYSKRPLLETSRTAQIELPFLSDHYTYLGSCF